MKPGKTYTITEVLEDEKRLDALVAQKKERKTIFKVCAWMMIASQMVLIIVHVIDWEMERIALPLAVMVMFLCLYQGYEQECRILELAKALRSNRDKEPEP